MDNEFYLDYGSLVGKLLTMMVSHLIIMYAYIHQIIHGKMVFTLVYMHALFSSVMHMHLHIHLCLFV